MSAMVETIWPKAVREDAEMSLIALKWLLGFCTFPLAWWLEDRGNSLLSAMVFAVPLVFHAWMFVLIALVIRDAFKPPKASDFAASQYRASQAKSHDPEPDESTPAADPPVQSVPKHYRIERISKSTALEVAR